MPKYLDGAGLSHFWESIKPKLGGVTQSGTGTVITSDDAANLPPLSLTVHGKSVQDGTPSPSSPVPIQSVESRNLFEPFFSTVTTINGITYTPNDDGTFLPSGTATAHSQKLTPRKWLPAGVYRLSGCPAGGSASTYYLRALAYSAQTGGTLDVYATDTGNGANLTVPDGGRWVLLFSDIPIGAAPQGIWKPMLEYGSTARDYQPYGSVSIVSHGTNFIRNGSERYSLTTTQFARYDGDKVPDGTEHLTFSVSADVPSGQTLALYGIVPATGSNSIIGRFTQQADGRYVCTPAANEMRYAPCVTEWRIYSQPYTGGTSVVTTVYDAQLELGSTATAYEPYSTTTTPIDLQGHALHSLPDGTQDTLEVDGDGNVTLTKRIGLTTTATTDGITATIGTDAMSTTGTLADGATVIYKLATPQTIDLGTIDLPSLPSPSFSMHVDASVTPTLDAEWFTEGGGRVIDAVSTRITALESEVAELQGQVPEREVLYGTSTWTIVKYGRTVMVQVHGATATPSTSTALVTGILADCKPAYNCSATVLTSSGASTQAARMAVYADTGNVYIVPAGYSSSASWYGTLTYIY